MSFLSFSVQVPLYIPNVLVLSSRSGDFNRFTVVSDMVEREGVETLYMQVL